jgi:hypothetical protein
MIRPIHVFSSLISFFQIIIIYFVGADAREDISLPILMMPIYGVAHICQYMAQEKILLSFAWTISIKCQPSQSFLF